MSEKETADAPPTKGDEADSMLEKAIEHYRQKKGMTPSQQAEHSWLLKLARSALAYTGVKKLLSIVLLLLWNPELGYNVIKVHASYKTRVLKAVVGNKLGYLWPFIRNGWIAVFMVWLFRQFGSNDVDGNFTPYYDLGSRFPVGALLVLNLMDVLKIICKDIRWEKFKSRFKLVALTFVFLSIIAGMSEWRVFESFNWFFELILFEFPMKLFLILLVLMTYEYGKYLLGLRFRNYMKVIGNQVHLWTFAEGKQTFSRDGMVPHTDYPDMREVGVKLAGSLKLEREKGPNVELPDLAGLPMVHERMVEMLDLQEIRSH